MRRTGSIIGCACLWLFAVAAASQEATTGDNWEGLVSVTPKRLDALALMPGSDFRPYRKLLLEPATIAFRKEWDARVREENNANH